MPIDTKTVLLGFLVPIAIVTLFMLASWRPWATLRYEISEADDATRDPKHRVPRGWWGSALGIGLAVVAAQYGVASQISFPPIASYDWRFVAAVGIVPIALIFALVRIPLAVLLPLRFVISAAAVTGIAWRRFTNEQWDLGDGILRVAAFALVVTIFWTLIESIAYRMKGATPIVITAGLCLASAPILIFDAAYNSAGMGAMTLAALLLPAIVLAWLRKPISIARGGASIIGLTLPLLWVDPVVWEYGEINAWQTAAFLLAPLGALVWLAPWIRDRVGWLRGLLTIGAVALLPAVVVLETLSRVNWNEYGIDLPSLRGGGDDSENGDGSASDYGYPEYD